MYICGVRFDEVTRETSADLVRKFLLCGRQHRIFTPNPEMVVLAQTDKSFQKILNNSSLNICDGVGVRLVSKNKLQRIPGIDFMMDVCEISASAGQSVFLLGSGDKAVIERSGRTLVSLFHNLRVVGTDPGPELQSGMDENLGVLVEEDNERILNQIILATPDVLLVGFGQIKQEKWIDYFLPQLPSVKLAMGVGGAFDVLAGKIKRAPKLFQKIGLEWLWRFFLEPWRAKRIWRATAVFLVTFFLYKKPK